MMMKLPILPCAEKLQLVLPTAPKTWDNTDKDSKNRTRSHWPRKSVRVWVSMALNALVDSYFCHNVEKAERVNWWSQYSYICMQYTACRRSVWRVRREGRHARFGDVQAEVFGERRRQMCLQLVRATSQQRQALGQNFSTSVLICTSV